LSIQKSGFDASNQMNKMIRVFVFSLLLFCMFAGLLVSNSFAKRLEVIVDRANVHLDPDENSPIVETLGRGAILSLASALKSRVSWFYVYFTSGGTGATRSGYILDSLVQKLYDDLRVITISSGSEMAVERNDVSRYFSEKRWGISQEKIAEAEGTPDAMGKTEGSDVFGYQRKILGMDCKIEYVFVDNKLVMERFSFVKQYADVNKHIVDYQRLRNLLIQTHGEPQGDKVRWQGEPQKRDASVWAQALALGQVDFHADWKAKGAEISLALYRDNSNNKIFLESECRGLQPLKVGKGALL
jgi:hypothetical protein